MSGELIIALVALGGVILAQWVTIHVNRQNLDYQMRVLQVNHSEQKRIEWKNYLIELMKKLIEAREAYEQFLGGNKESQEIHAGIIGKAISVCLATNDNRLSDLADKELTPYFAKKEDGDNHPLDWATRNRNSLQEAIKLLSKIIKES